MTNITIKERTNVMTDITERATAMKNIMERAAIVYVIAEQYGKYNCNDEHYGTTIMTYITALKCEWKAVQV